MKISTFNPHIVSKESEEIIKLFESLGFEKRHVQTDIDNRGITSVVLKNKDGFKVDVASSEKVPQDLAMIRMNVDDFDEVYDFLTDKGFVNQGGSVVEAKSSKSAMMRSPSGFAFVLCQHIKEHD